MPALHTRVSRREALAAFGGDGSAPSFCDGAFVKLDRAVLLFATLGGPEETRLETASWLAWVPRSLATVAAGQDDPHPWLPAPIRERFDTARESCFEHFVLVRLPQDGDSSLFCGNAHLGSWGTRNDGRHEACFSLLEERLTPDAWRALGGWTGWHVTIDDECFDVQCEQTEVFAERLDHAAAKDRVEIMLDAPTGETFTCYLNAARGALSYMAGTGEPWTLGLRDPA